tara:strand:+ start:25 stop:300 length:276 start_codon:yes stop_codon:yes gene_type:complete
MYAWEYATETDLDRMDAEERGAARPDVAWVCTDRDVWHANPHYKGEPVPHPLDEEVDYLNYLYSVERMDAMEARGGPKTPEPYFDDPDCPF